MNRRVVITGIGVISPNGIGKESFFKALAQGTSGIKEIREFDTSCYRSSLGGEVTDFNPRDYLSPEEITDLDRTCHFVLASAHMAIKDSGLTLDLYDSHRAGVIVGTTTATNRSNYHNQWIDKGYESITYKDVLRFKSETIPNCVSVKYNLNGPSLLVSNACAAGTYAIGQAFDMIKNGRTDLMLAGGSEGMSESAMCGFNSTRSIARNGSRPFSKNRDGLLVSEGSAICILESMDLAIRRDAHIYGEIIGYGLSSTAHRMTTPDVQGESAALSMHAALNDAHLQPEDIDYVNAHGTATPLNDKMETNAHKLVFGKRAYDLPISSIKSMIGHSFGASGAIEIAACLFALEEGIIPPTTNYQEEDPDCDLFYVPNKAVKRNVKIIMSNSYAFGGNNASLIIRKFERD